MNRPGQPGPSDGAAAIAIGLIALLARIPWLGRLGLHSDEDISTLAARGIARTGLPILPSGHHYWRDLVYHYAIAPLAAPGVDWWPRIPSVVFSAVACALLVYGGQRLVGRTAARAAGILFALSLVEIYIARLIRMYALYQLLSLVVLYLLYRFWESGRLRWGLGSVAAMIVALGAHELAATLAILYIPVALRHGDRRVRALCALAVPLLGSSYLLLDRWTVLGLTGGHPELGEPGPAGPPPSPHFRTSIGTAPLAFGLERLGSPTYPILIGVAALAGAGLAWAGTRGRPAFHRVAAIVGVATALAAAAGCHPGLALAILALLALQRPELFPGRPGARALKGAAAISLGLGLTWATCVAAAGFGLRDAAIGLVLEPFRLAHLLLWPRAIGIAAGAAAVVIAIRCWRGTAGAAQQFLVLTIAWLVTSRSVLHWRIATRYLSDLLPVWELLAGSAAAAAIVGASRIAPARRWAPGMAAVLLLGGTMLLPGTSPAPTLGFLRRTPGSWTGARGWIEEGIPDLREACAWLKPRLRPGDRVAATDWLTSACYLGRVDGWIRTQEYGWQTIRVDGVPRDCYVGAELLPDVAAVRAFAAHGPLWVVASAEELFGHSNPLAPDMRAWVLAQPPAFVAADGGTRVFRLEPPAR